MKKVILILLGFTSTFAVADNQNSLNNVLNNNGSVGNVTITQSNHVTEEQIDSEEKINAIVMKVQEALQNGTQTIQDNQRLMIATQASDINAMNASNVQKNKLCQSKIKVSASILGYDIDLGAKTCDEIFTINQ